MNWADFHSSDRHSLDPSTTPAAPSSGKSEKTSEREKKIQEAALSPLEEGLGAAASADQQPSKPKARKILLPPPLLLGTTEEDGGPAKVLKGPTKSKRPRPTLLLDVEGLGKADAAFKDSLSPDRSAKGATNAVEMALTEEAAIIPRELELGSFPMSPRSERLASELTALGYHDMSLTLVKVCATIRPEELIRSASLEYLPVSEGSEKKLIGYVFEEDRILVVNPQVLGRGNFKDVRLAVDVSTRTLRALGEYVDRGGSLTLAHTRGPAKATPGLDGDEIGPKLLPGISHPNILQCRLVRSGGTLTGLIEMDFLPGGDLKSYFEKMDPFTSPEDAKTLIGLFKDGSRGIRFLTEHGLIHGDLKPENFIVQTTATGASLVVGDLDGLRPISAYMGALQEAGRTISYMAPESTAMQLNFLEPKDIEGYDPCKEDVFAYGLTLYRLIAGKLPADFGRDFMSKLLPEGETDNPAQIRWRETITRGLSETLEKWQLPAESKRMLAQIIVSALEPNPTKRPRIELLHEALEAL